MNKKCLCTKCIYPKKKPILSSYLQHHGILVPQVQWKLFRSVVTKLSCCLANVQIPRPCSTLLLPAIRRRAWESVFGKCPRWFFWSGKFKQHCSRAAFHFPRGDSWAPRKWFSQDPPGGKWQILDSGPRALSLSQTWGQQGQQIPQEEGMERGSPTWGGRRVQKCVKQITWFYIGQGSAKFLCKGPGRKESRLCKPCNLS